MRKTKILLSAVTLSAVLTSATWAADLENIKVLDNGNIEVTTTSDLTLPKGEIVSDMKVLIPFLEKNVVSVEEYFKLDENSLLYCCSLIQDKDDEIAADLARRLQNRRLFEYVDYSEENLAQIKNMLKEQNLDEKYYLRVENVEASVYSPYKGRKILIEQLDGKIVALEKASTIVESITKGETKREGTIFYPR